MGGTGIAGCSSRPFRYCNGCGVSDSQGNLPVRSNQPGGVNAALGDASIRFVSQTTDFNLWRGLGSRTGGETATVR